MRVTKAGVVGAGTMGAAIAELLALNGIEVVLKDVPKPAQIARYAPDHSLIGVTSLNSDTVSLIDPSFREQTAIKVGSQPMDMAFRGDELFVACQGDGSMHIIDIPKRRAKASFRAGTGCESVGFF